MAKFTIYNIHNEFTLFYIDSMIIANEIYNKSSNVSDSMCEEICYKPKDKMVSAYINTTKNI